MSKRDLKKYLNIINKEQLEEQIIDLYTKFNDVKVYYNFVFNPKEDKLFQEAKLKISNEYFPIRGRKPKLRRSVAQKIIKHFITLGVDAFIIADVMLFSIEIAQNYSAEKHPKQDAFYKSMLNSFELCMQFMIEKNILNDFKSRVEVVANKASKQNWINKYEFNTIIERMHY